jgi:hypothetical protein
MATNQAMDNLNAILMVCGVADPVQRTNIIVNESFTSLEDFCMFENDKDVNRMASRLASRTIQEGRVHLGTIVIKKLQALVFWCKDHQMRGANLVAAEFTQAALMEVMENKQV